MANVIVLDKYKKTKPQKLKFSEQLKKQHSGIKSAIRIGAKWHFS